MTTKVMKSQNKKEDEIKKLVIPSFGFKSAMMIVFTAAISSLFLPMLMSQLQADKKVTTLICNTIFISFAICYTQFFIETKRGFVKQFFILFILFSIGIAIICYFWLFIGLYM